MLDFAKNIYHLCLAWLSNIFYGFPSRKLFVLGVTGTKGKSTTVELINALLEAAGKKTAVISSLRFKIDKENQKNKTGMTMPGRFFIQKLLRQAVNAGCDYALVEVTSQGILQHRHQFIDWDAAMFLNLQPEHIEAHGSFEKYREAKVSFFRYVAEKSRKKNKLFFVNEDDASREYFVSAVGTRGKIKYYSREEFIEKDLDRGKISIGDWLSSQFNLENAAAAAAFAVSQGINWKLIQKTFKSFKGVPGRMEMIQEKPFRVVIDYAHTPDSLEKIYQVFFSQRSNGGGQKLICVLGSAGGGRDKWKRPAMGKIAAEYCQAIFLTNEDPYDENPEEILDQIESGVKKKTKVYKILDRREAIKKALDLARKGDTVIITGKGSESWLHLAQGKKIPWCERCVVKEVLKKG